MRADFRVQRFQWPTSEPATQASRKPRRLWRGEQSRSLLATERSTQFERRDQRRRETPTRAGRFEKALQTVWNFECNGNHIQGLNISALPVPTPGFTSVLAVEPQK